jgi:hypothetical protein
LKEIYTSLNIFNLKSLKIISNSENSDEYYNNSSEELEELYYLSEININNFLLYHYDILITELSENFKEATCIKLKLSNIDILLGFDINDVIYIKTEPSKCYERVHIRAREGEELIPLSYLEECHKYHEEFLDLERGLFKEQLVLDGNNDIYLNPGVADDWMRQIDANIFKH